MGKRAEAGKDFRSIARTLGMSKPTASLPLNLQRMDASYDLVSVITCCVVSMGAVSPIVRVLWSASFFAQRMT